MMNELLAYPSVQAGVAPFVVALIVVLLLQRAGLAGLAVPAAFFTTYALVEGLTFTPLTVTHRLALLAAAAPVVGVLADFAFRPTRAGVVVLALAAAAGTLWMLWPVLQQKDAHQAWLLGASSLALVTVLVTVFEWSLRGAAVRAGSAGLALGLGVGVAAIFGASAKYGSLGISLGAAAGAFLLPQMIMGRGIPAGTTYALPTALTCGLVASGAMVIAEVPWYAALALALVPAATCMPIPQRAPVWIQAFIASLYGFVAAAAACWLAWPHKGSIV
jgi:hypothetical protein